MNNPFVDMGMYAGASGNIGEMLKALTTTYETDPAAPMTGGDALRTQFLDRMLYDVAHQERHIKLFTLLKKEPLTSNIAEWVTRGEYGSPWGAVAGSGDNPPVNTADLERHVGFAKYYRTLRAVDHPTSIIRNIVSAVAEEEEAGTKFLLQHIEHDLFFGDASIIPEQFSGLLPQIISNGEPESVIDMHATYFQDDFHVHDLAAVIAHNGGDPTHCFVDTYSAADITKGMLQNQRFVPRELRQGMGPIDMGVASIQSTFGTMVFEPSIFLNPTRGYIARKTDPLWKYPTVARGGDASNPAPATPTIDSAVAGGTDGDTTNFPTGAYQYRVTAVNKNGESAATAATAVNVTAGQHVALTVTHTDATTTGFRVYKSACDGVATDCRFMYHFAADPSGTTVWNDTGEFIPGCTCAFVLDQSSKPAYDFMQLLPMMKLPFGVRRPQIEWLQMIYGFARLVFPWRAAVIKNILPSALAASWNPLAVVAPAQ